MMTRIRNILKWNGWIWNDPEGPVLPSRYPPFQGILANIKADLRDNQWHVSDHPQEWVPAKPWALSNYWPHREVIMLSDGRFVYQDGSPAIHGS